MVIGKKEVSRQQLSKLSMPFFTCLAVTGLSWSLPRCFGQEPRAESNTVAVVVVKCWTSSKLWDVEQVWDVVVWDVVDVVDAVVWNISIKNIVKYLYNVYTDIWGGTSSFQQHMCHPKWAHQLRSQKLLQLHSRLGLHSGRAQQVKLWLDWSDHRRNGIRYFHLQGPTTFLFFSLVKLKAHQD